MTEIFASFMRHLPGVAFVKDPQGRYLYLTESAAVVLGREREECLGKRVSELIPADLAELLEADDREVLAENQVRTFYEELPGDDGTRTWLVSKFPLPAGDRTLLGGVGVDVTELIRLRDERERLIGEQMTAEERLRALTQRLMEAGESERREVARELHDEVGQLLTALKLLLAQPVDETARKEAVAVVDELFGHIHDLTLGLRPPLLDSLGLEPALRFHLARFESQVGLETAGDFRGIADRRLPEAVENAAFRIVQEALTNVARHAGSDSARVEVVAGASELRVVVADEGAGFDPAEVEGTAGLSGMRERARLAGGELDIESAPGSGTVVRARLPLTEARKSA